MSSLRGRGSRARLPGGGQADDAFLKSFLPPSTRSEKVRHVARKGVPPGAAATPGTGACDGCERTLLRHEPHPGNLMRTLVESATSARQFERASVDRTRMAAGAKRFGW